MSSIWGVEGRFLRAAPPERCLGPVRVLGLPQLEEDLYRPEIYPGSNYTPTYANYTPKPRCGCRRFTRIESRGSYTSMSSLPPGGVIFIFVQGKESACIVTRDLGQDKDQKILNLKMNFYGLADPRFKQFAIFRKELQPDEIYTYAYLSALFNADDVNEPSSHKESSSRPLNERAAIGFLRQRLEKDGFEETIRTAISALQCLYQENVKADEIEVYTAHADTNTHKFLSREEIAKHLLHVIHIKTVLSRGESAKCNKIFETPAAANIKAKATPQKTDGMKASKQAGKTPANQKTRTYILLFLIGSYLYLMLKFFARGAAGGLAPWML